MCHAYWKAGRHELNAVFDLFFRKPPFGGGYTVVAGLSECLSLLQHFRFTEENIAYLRKAMGVESVPRTFHCKLSPHPFSSFSVHAFFSLFYFFVSHRDEGFFKWLSSLNCSQVTLYAIPEGSFAYPREPILRVEGPLAVCQLLGLFPPQPSVGRKK